MLRLVVGASRTVQSVCKRRYTCVLPKTGRQTQQHFVSRSLVTATAVTNKAKRKAKDASSVVATDALVFAPGEGVDKAIFRLRRKLRRFVLHPRTEGKLEAIWILYEGIKRSTSWRINDRELAQFLRAILRKGVGMAWYQRAEQLAGESAVLGREATMGLLRVYAKYGDTHKFETTAREAERLLGEGWSATHGDYVETHAIAYARADLPAQAQSILENNPSSDPSRSLGLLELLLAWTRARKVDQAWATLSQLQALGSELQARGWNALLHMHAVDERYKMELVEKVYRRMLQAGGTADQATFNILMHAALVRGRQGRWNHWYQRMEAAGFAADAYTHTALAAALIDAGHWAEAARVIRHMRSSGDAPTPATAVAAMQMQRRRGRVAVVMARFRQVVSRGAVIEPYEFTQVAGEALADTREWVAEIALLIRCLEDGRVPASPDVDALAAHLPGLSAEAMTNRPLLQSLYNDPVQASQALVASLSAQDQHPIGSSLVVGEHRKSYAATLNAVVRNLLRCGRLRQAEQLVHAAHRAQIDVDSVKTRDTSDWLAKLISDFVAVGRFGDAAPHVARLERLIETAPSVRAFNALLRYASASRDELAVESIWRRMTAAGVSADAGCHRARIMCYSAIGDLLSTRRAYSDMLDDGYAPDAVAVAAVVRCCVRKTNVGLAVTVVRHAERHGCVVFSGTYNMIMSRSASLPDYHHLIDSMFASMLATPDNRLFRATGDMTERVVELRERFADLRKIPAGSPRNLHGWLMPDEHDTEYTRRALVAWLTSLAAYPAAPSLSDPSVRKFGESETTPPQPAPAPLPLLAPPPNATTFIIAMRFYGQNRRWSDVVRAWNSLAQFNCRVSAMSEKYPFAGRYHITPFSRMVVWAARALVETGQSRDARALWDSAAYDGTLGDNARVLGMGNKLRQLKLYEVTDEVY
ncbi:hypothetical protein FBU31_000144 [Coemansia sp. 'formosensis']|nr:hypothetical protein FBU31_000144 [Coemansia sp. 'formosensis']